MIVGLTGGIGSGKSTIAKLFASLPNVVVYIADDEAKKLMNSSNKIKDNLIKEFGLKTYLNNKLQTDFLSKIVFNNPEKLAKLNAIVHPEVKSHFLNFVHKTASKNLIIYENAILFESKSNTYCDLIITVFSPLSERIHRVANRDNCSEATVLKKIKNQLNEDSKLLRSHYVIYNETAENNNNQVNFIYNILTKKHKYF